MVFPNRQFPGIQVFAPATTLTNAWVAGTIVSMDEANAIGIDITYTPGSETNLQIKVESTNDTNIPGTGLTNSSNWYQQVTQSAAAGVVTLVPALYEIAASNYSSTTGNFTILVNPIKGSGIRISMMYSGGSGPGTASITAYTGWV